MAIELVYDGHCYFPLSSETVLDCLLRNGHQIPSSCKIGACQSCLMQAHVGEPGAAAQQGLRETLRVQNYFLACQCIAAQAMSISLPSLQGSSVKAKVVGKEQLCHNVVLLRLEPLDAFPCRPGQYINIVREEDSLARSYSIANLPEQEGVIELHIRRIEDGKMSTWVFDEVTDGDSLYVRGPAGDCFYLASDGDRSFPILLAATGTGLAPLEGILRDALMSGHNGVIHILHGALRKDDLYHVEILRELSEQHANVHYRPCVMDGEPGIQEIFVGSLDDLVVKTVNELDKTELRAFFCGAPDMVNLLRKKAFLAGVSSKHIMSDSFLIGQ